MICIHQENIVIAILATHFYLLFCKLVSKIYKTKYAGFLVLSVYLFKLMYLIEPENYSPLADVLNSLFYIWLICFIDMIADSIFSHGFFVMIFLNILS
jgi:hypothetical protein